MKEIKFREWDGYAMRYGGFSVHATTGKIEPLAGLSTVKDDSPLMQYTGLKDANGRDVYEGDILHEKYKWIVEYKNGGFVVTRLRKNGFDFDSLHKIIAFRKKAGIPIEIIGNIYKNHELLNTHKSS